MKKNRILRKAAALLLAGAMLAGTASAEGESRISGNSTHVISQVVENSAAAREDDSISCEIREYVNREIPQHLAGLNYYGSYTMSDIIPIHNWGGADLQKYLVVVSDNGKMIGSLTVEYINGKIISLYREENIPELNAVIANNVPFQLGYSNDCFMISTNAGISVIDNPEFVDTGFISQLAVRAELNEKAAYSKSVAAANRTRTTTYQVSPAVKNVSNDKNPDVLDEKGNHRGLCWAACVASVGMQYTSQTGYTAMSIYNLCNNSTASDRPLDYPIGELSWYLFSLKSIFEITAMQTNALSSNQVQNLMLANRPIIVRLKRPADNGTDRKGHAMVLFMYNNFSSTSGQYIFMDPGGSSSGAGRVSVIIDSTIMTNGSGLTITSRNGFTYDTWENSIYRR